MNDQNLTFERPVIKQFILSLAINKRGWWTFTAFVNGATVERTTSRTQSGAMADQAAFMEKWGFK